MPVSSSGVVVWHVCDQGIGVQGLALSTFQVVLVPTVLGVLTNEFFPSIVKKLKPILPLIGVALTTLLCASPCAQVATILRFVLRCSPIRCSSCACNQCNFAYAISTCCVLTGLKEWTCQSLWLCSMWRLSQWDTSSAKDLDSMKRPAGLSPLRLVRFWDHSWRVSPTLAHKFLCTYI